MPEASVKIMWTILDDLWRITEDLTDVIDEIWPY